MTSSALTSALISSAKISKFGSGSLSFIAIDCIVVSSESSTSSSTLSLSFAKKFANSVGTDGESSDKSSGALIWSVNRLSISSSTGIVNSFSIEVVCSISSRLFLKSIGADTNSCSGSSLSNPSSSNILKSEFSSGSSSGSTLVSLTVNGASLRSSVKLSSTVTNSSNPSLSSLSAKISISSSIVSIWVTTDWSFAAITSDSKRTASSPSSNAKGSSNNPNPSSEKVSANGSLVATSSLNKLSPNWLSSNWLSSSWVSVDIESAIAFSCLASWSK